MNFTWYSSLSTGVFEVDEQHSSLDQLLDYLVGVDEAMQRILLPKYLERLKDHFVYEEGLVVQGVSFADEAHTMAHRDLEFHAEKIIESALRKGTIDMHCVASELSLGLMSHVTNFDAPIQLSNERS